MEWMGGGGSVHAASTGGRTRSMSDVLDVDQVSHLPHPQPQPRWATCRGPAVQSIDSLEHCWRTADIVRAAPAGEGASDTEPRLRTGMHTASACGMMLTWQWRR